MSLPQLPHQAEEGEESENVIIIPIDGSVSDGDKSTWPTEARFGMPNDSSYREKLAMLWLQKIGAYEEGMDNFYFLISMITIVIHRFW